MEAVWSQVYVNFKRCLWRKTVPFSCFSAPLCLCTLSAVFFCVLFSFICDFQIKYIFLKSGSDFCFFLLRYPEIHCKVTVLPHSFLALP